MQIRLLAFGITSDILGTNSNSYECNDSISVGELRSQLENSYPKLKQFSTYSVAVNQSYANDELTLNSNDEVALIPPVSGG